jgi:hypothetical protein
MAPGAGHRYQRDRGDAAAAGDTDNEVQCGGRARGRVTAFTDGVSDVVASGYDEGFCSFGRSAGVGAQWAGVVAVSRGRRRL